MSVVFDTIQPVFDRDDSLRVDYPWDAWRSTSYFMFMNEDLAPVLDTLSHAAQAAFVLANTEWVCARHFREPRSVEVLQYVDAVWAGALTGASVVFREFPESEWQGPILGPLCFAQLLAAEQHFEGRHDGATVARASWAHNLALHVIGKNERHVFDKWTADSLEALKANHPYELPRWNSIFDAEFSNVDRCPPNVFLTNERYVRSNIDIFVAEHMARVQGSPYLAVPLGAL